MDPVLAAIFNVMDAAPVLVPAVSTNVPVVSGRVRVTVPRAPVGGLTVMVPDVTLLNATPPTDVPPTPNVNTDVPSVTIPATTLVACDPPPSTTELEVSAEAFVVQVAQAIAPAALSVMGDVADTATVPAAAGRLMVTVPRAPVTGDRVTVPVVALWKPIVPTVVPAKPRTGVAVYMGAIAAPVGFPHSVPAPALARVRVTVPVDALLEINEPSPVTEFTAPPPPLQLVNDHADPVQFKHPDASDGNTLLSNPTFSTTPPDVNVESPLTDCLAYAVPPELPMRI